MKQDDELGRVGEKERTQSFSNRSGLCNPQSEEHRAARRAFSLRAERRKQPL